MSVMTKLFIVLLIICSLLMTAATVVFVNRTEDFHKAATNSEERANRFQRDKEAAQRDADAARTRETEAIATAKELLKKVAERPVQDTIGLTADTIAARRVSGEGQEGMRAFLEKRKAIWNVLPDPDR